MDPTETRKEELLAVNKLIKNNRLSGLRAAEDYIADTLFKLERRLQTLRSTEALILQKIRRDLTLIEIEEDHTADHFKRDDPIQAVNFIDPNNLEPDELIIYARNKILTLAEGTQSLIRESNRIAHDIKQVQLRMVALRIKQNEVNSRVIKQKIRKDVDRGKIPEDFLEKDRIVERSVAEVFLLNQISEFYRQYSLDINSNVKYTQTNSIIELLSKLRIKFVAFAERNPYVLSGQLSLNLEDPGAKENRAVLSNLIEKLRKVSQNEEVETKVQKYANALVSNINDPNVSFSISSKKEPKGEPAPAESQRRKTRFMSKVLQFTETAIDWWTESVYDTYPAAAEKAFYKFITRLHGNRSFCNNQQDSAESNNRKEQQEEKDTFEDKGRSEYQKGLEKEGIDIKSLPSEFRSG